MRHLNPGVQFFHAQTRHVSGLAGKSPTFATEVMVHPLLMALCDTILGPSCARYQLNLAHLLERLPGAGDQFWHRDEIVWNLVPEPKPELQLASVIALVDFPTDHGATRGFPGSHRWEPDRYPPDEEAVAAEMPAGSAVALPRFDVSRRRSPHRFCSPSRRPPRPTPWAGCGPRRTTTWPFRPRWPVTSHGSARRSSAMPSTMPSSAAVVIWACSTCATRSSSCKKAGREPSRRTERRRRSDPW